MPGQDEAAFQRWYAQMARDHDLNPNPEGQHYDYRAAFRAGAKPDASGHWPSDFKQPGHPNEVVGGFNTRTGERVLGTKRAKDAAELVSLGWDSTTATRLAQMPEPTTGARMPDQFDALAKRFGGTETPDQGQPAPRPGYDAPPARAEDFMDQPTQPEGSAAGRFGAGAWSVLNPLAMLEGVFNAVRHPLDTAKNVASAQLEQGRLSLQRGQEGRPLESMGHGLAAVLPLLGPAAAHAGETIASGDVFGGLGQGAGLLIPAAGPSAVRVASRALPNRAATALEAGAAGRVADVMSPNVGPNKVRFGNQAQKVAPEVAKDLAKDGAPWTREGLQTQMGGKLAEAEQALDAASDARLAARTFETKPLIDDLLARRRELTAEAVEGSRIGPESGPIGKNVVPGPNAARVAQIDQALAELQQLGPVARYESIRRVRQAYDQPAKVKYNPSMTADYLKAQGGASGAADVTGVLREHLAKWDPETAAANADYHVYRSADDVLRATQEIERTRPKVGRAIMARLTGTLGGGQVAGPVGAVAGFIGAPIVESLVGSGITTKLKTAATMQRLAQAIRGGNHAEATALIDSIKRLTAQGAALSTNPSGSRMQPVPASGPQQ